jgi:hypothetical protein
VLIKASPKFEPVKRKVFYSNHLIKVIISDACQQAIAIYNKLQKRTKSSTIWLDIN